MFCDSISYFKGISYVKLPHFQSIKLELFSLSPEAFVMNVLFSLRSAPSVVKKFVSVF